MPIYEFVCDGCGDEWEVIRSMSECGDPVSCKVCGEEARLKYSVHSSTPFRARVISHIAPEPVFVESQSQLDKVCKENNSYILKDDRSKQRKYKKSREKDLKKSMVKRAEKKMAIGG